MSAPFKATRTSRPALALLGALLTAASSHAAPRPLAEAEMRAVRGADGSIRAPLAPAVAAAAGAPPLFGGGFAALFSSSGGATLLGAAEFSAALAAAGLTPAMLPAWDGQPVMQTRVDTPPLTFRFDFSTLLASAGLSYSGPSMGNFTLNNFDARGTTIWVWQHP